MTRKKLSSSEKKLKALLSSKGGLTILQTQVQNIFEGHPGKDEVFVPLERLLVAVSNFQDKHRKDMDALKTNFKGNETIMVYLGPLHVHIKTSGRDIWKSEKHKSFVKNRTGVIKKSRLSIRPTYEPVNDSRIFLGNDYYDTAQPLSFVKSSRTTGLANENMVKDLKVKVEQFLEENYNKISVNITELRELLK
ncbi:MAG: hypothetical protein WAZ12_03660 [Candidatus Absconditicoccaceae bacterium]